MATSHYKPVGGVVGVRLYPANAVESAVFEDGQCEVVFSEEGVEVELIDDASVYEERVENEQGVLLVEHRLTLVAERNRGQLWLSGVWQDRVATEGVVAVVELCDGRVLLVGYSPLFGAEQTLHLDSLLVSSGKRLLDTPSITLTLVSYDTGLSCEITTNHL